MASSFFHPGAVSRESHLASLHLSRDQSLPVVLSTVASTAAEEGYAEGVVVNTKFGSFPHSTLINVKWGSQVRASNVDTGSRGRKSQQNTKKRKAQAISTNSPATDAYSSAPREAIEAASGYIHILPPTPENWTTSLPHRTQVVYTADYSYILHRIQARPGSVLIEAGSGSGSFTHAAARAVYNGLPMSQHSQHPDVLEQPGERTGRVYTYEFHPERHRKVVEEMLTHNLDSIVHATHRDVYQDGFLLHDSTTDRKTSPKANSIFLDLPAPWKALPHLTRGPVPETVAESPISALDPGSPVHMCTFSPCIEQVQKTISTLRQLGWLEIEMVEIQHRRLDVRREYVGLRYDGMRSVNAVPETVEEAVAKLQEDEIRAAAAQAGKKLPNTSKQTRKLESKNNHGKQQDAAKLIYNDGRVVHRSEPELKTHTSYLVFAVLPRLWTEADEIAAETQLQESIDMVPSGPKSQRQLKREAKQKRRAKSARKSDKSARTEPPPESVIPV